MSLNQNIKKTFLKIKITVIQIHYEILYNIKILFVYSASDIFNCLEIPT